MESGNVEVGERTIRWLDRRKDGLPASAALIAIAVAFGSAIYFVTCLRRSDQIPPIARAGTIVTPETEEARDLVRALAASAHAASERRGRVAVFWDEPNTDPPDPLLRILESEPTWSSTLVGPEDIRDGKLEQYDVSVFAGGRGSLQLAALGDQGRQAVRAFVRNGGGYVGICAGGFLATTNYLTLIDAEAQTGDREIPGVGVRSMMVRGPATVSIELTDAGRQIFGEAPGLLNLDFAGGPVFLRGGRTELPPCVPLARYRSEVTDIEPQRGTMIGSPSILSARYGRGRVLVFSPHPERTKGLETMVKQAILAVARSSTNALAIPPTPNGR